MILARLPRKGARFGNHMYAYMMGRTLATKFNTKFIYPTFLGDKIFDFDDNEIRMQDIPINFVARADEYFDVDPYSIKYANDVIIKSYFQNINYFDLNLLRSWMNISNPINTADDICYIHYRGKDYKKFKRLLDVEYFNDAMDLMRLKYGITKFEIITDDIKLAKHNFPEIKVSNNCKIVDFKTLFDSKYLIMSNSTFCWWAAIPDKITVFPKYWMGRRSKEWYPSKNIYSPHFTHII